MTIARPPSLLSAWILASGLALFQADLAGAEPAPAAVEQVLGPGDRITVTVFGFPDISGDQTLDGQGTIVLPIGGPIAAASLTSGQLERKIAGILADGYILRPRVSVRAGELRPVYVLGDVRTAGAVPFRQGMTVLTALAQAGGSAAAADAMASRADLLGVEERLEIMGDQRTALRARLARLIARRDGADTFEFPPNTETGNPDGLRLLAGERAVFDSEHEAEERQLTLLTQQAKDAAAEVAAVAEQMRLNREQTQTTSSYLTDLAKLARDGLVERRRVVEMQQEKSRLEADLARLGTESARASQHVRETTLRIAEIRASAHQSALVGLQETNARLAELDTSIAAAREMVAVRRQRAGAAMPGVAADRTRMTITRTDQDGMHMFEALETTALRPGDVVRMGGEGPVELSRAAIRQPGTIDPISQ